MHFHSLTPDGLFVPDSAAGSLAFAPIEPPSGEEIARLTRRAVRRLSKIASRYLADRDDDYVHLDPDDEQATLDHALSVAQRPPIRPQGGLGLAGLEPSAPPRKELCTALGGVSLHAARVVESHDREPVQFLKRLASLLPAPYQNTVRYHGVFANRSRYRPRLPVPTQTRDDQTPERANAHPCVVEPHLADTLYEQQTTLPLEAPDVPDVPDDFQQGLPAVRPRRLPWASLLKRSLGIDGLACPGCGAQMVLLALITTPPVVARILDHLRIPSTPPPVAPAHPSHVNPVATATHQSTVPRCVMVSSTGDGVSYLSAVL